MAASRLKGEQHLVSVAARQAIGSMHVNTVKGARATGVLKGPGRSGEPERPEFVDRPPAAVFNLDRRCWRLRGLARTEQVVTKLTEQGRQK